MQLPTIALVLNLLSPDTWLGAYIDRVGTSFDAASRQVHEELSWDWGDYQRYVTHIDVTLLISHLRDEVKSASDQRLVDDLWNEQRDQYIRDLWGNP